MATDHKTEGSSPSGDIHSRIAQLAEPLTLTQEVTGSSPVAVVQPRGVTAAHNTLTVTDAVQICAGLRGRLPMAGKRSDMPPISVQFASSVL